MRRLGSVTARSGCFSWLGIRSSLLLGCCLSSDKLFSMDLFWQMLKPSLNEIRFLRRLVKWLQCLSRPIGRPRRLLWIFRSKVGMQPMLRLRKTRLGCSKKLAWIWRRWSFRRLAVWCPIRNATCLKVHRKSRSKAMMKFWYQLCVTQQKTKNWFQ